MPRLAYDLDLFRPGCVLLQAVLGGDRATLSMFPTESWLLAPTPGLRIYDIPADELEKAAKLAWMHVELKVPFDKVPRRKR